MSIKESILMETEREAASTVRLLSVLRDEDKTYKPHEKSMSINALASHIALLQTWFNLAIKDDSLDITTDITPIAFTSFKELSEIVDRRVKENLEFAKNTTDEFWQQTFTFKAGDRIIMQTSKIGFYRSMITNHLIHHRGQLTVYLRLLNQAVSGLYGPSADEK